MLGFDGLVGSDTSTTTGFVSLASDPETKHKWYGSGFLKQERSAGCTTTTEDEWRSSKLAKTTDDNNISASKAMLLQQRNSLLRSNNNNNVTTTLFCDGQMLSFSSPKSEPFLVDKVSPNATLPFSYHPLSSYTRDTGIHSIFEVVYILGE